MAYNKGGGGSRFGESGGGRSSFGGSRFGRSDLPRGGFGGRRGDGPVTLYKATCAQCGNTCEVPFRPTGERPVYCKDCFARMGGNEGKMERGGDRGGDRRENRFEKREFRSHDTPKSYGEGSRGNAQGTDEVKKELQAMNIKLDRLIKVIEEVALGKVEGRSVEGKKEEKEEAPVAVKKAKRKGPKKT